MASRAVPMRSGREQAADAMPAESEASFQTRVVDAAERLGWRVFHVRRSSGWSETGKRRIPYVTENGWVDLVLGRHGQVLFREIKAERGRLSVDQLAWGHYLMSSGHNWGVWKPKDWPGIVRELGGEP